MVGIAEEPPRQRYSDHHAQVHKPYQVPLSSHSNTSLETIYWKYIHPILVVNLFTYATHTKI